MRQSGNNLIPANIFHAETHIYKYPPLVHSERAASSIFLLTLS